MKKALQGIIHRRSYDAALGKEVASWLDETIFAPVIQPVSIESQARSKPGDDKSAVAAALAAGTIWYASGYFYGQLNAAVSRELRELGARRTRERGAVFAIATIALPSYILAVAIRSAQRAESVHRETIASIEAIQRHLSDYPTDFSLRNSLDTIREDIQMQVSSTLSGQIEEEREIQISPADLAAQEAELAESLKRTIATTADDTLAEIARQVRENVSAGGRLDQLRERLARIRKKALRGTIAKTEVALGAFVAGIRNRLYESLGMREYVWQTKEDPRVRDDHVRLNQRVFSFDDPPVCDTRSGFRGNPGEAAGCRCVPLPILQLIESAA